ncbi:GFA family protein [Thalassococcus sp. CAU 1522]|uniref:GFA family protein n=1 Tax=Thalassococcus arenae TaxID=2851652 RepID=A0ABS6NAD2_9RHOB|nr:GFA family protein [Thalassococcus arenae]MBV2360974.1 GFA family protein [Thalassococcus arenae]
MEVDGRCLCGQITYVAVIDPDRVAICHCSDCQINSGSAFGVVAAVVEGRFTLKTGRLAEYRKIAESGRVRVLSFCPDCGTRIHAHTPGDPAAFFGLRAGTINQRAALTPRLQVWCQSALPWTADMTAIPARAQQGD